MAGIAIKGVRPGAIGFVGNYLPRRCGIATFTSDLAEALARVPGNRRRVLVVVMNDRAGRYIYPPRVKYEIQEEKLTDYARAARFLNTHCGVVSLQHEFGIFGGECGSYVMHLIGQLHVPLVVTCHTVFEYPDAGYRSVFRRIVSRANKLVVMNRRAVGLLETLYGARSEQIEFIHHGIHDMPFFKPPIKKKTFGVEGRVLLTFGLLHRNKGIEFMIDAMAEIVRSKPDTTYVIAGQTHPAVVREEGESYRKELEERVESLRLGKRVIFIDRFADLSDLVKFLGETDIFVAPYLNLDQMTSGALSYAVGAGKAVLATPFLHARELLAEGRGVIVPVRDARALAGAVLDLFNDEKKLESIRSEAYSYTRDMVWPAVAGDYLKVFEKVSRRVPAMLPIERRPPLPGPTIPAPSVRDFPFGKV